ncbi:ORF6C domain-containing protein [Paenibacillus aquistagni]|uniref:ORF6C domain-containing protein n=1 Tax=Paenibacillus aquistagni TaxID=1852522 RepID=UPI00145A1127|nr:ORF6C domain-containing protein [Paenibacillus aquistagni]NMM52130.1 hypothetical protein [Paenibacillus aquistagni]
MLSDGAKKRIQRAIAERVYAIAREGQDKEPYFQQLHRAVREKWNVESYHQIDQASVLDVINYIGSWRPKEGASMARPWMQELMWVKRNEQGVIIGYSETLPEGVDFIPMVPRNKKKEPSAKGSGSKTN